MRSNYERGEGLLGSSPGREPNFVLGFMMQRQYREIFVAAGLAAKRGNAQIPPEKPKE